MKDARRWSRPTAVAAASSLLTLLVASTLVEAQAPGGGTPLHACADARGIMRLGAESQACAAGESRVSWNAEGAQGAAGPAGAPGATGVQGAKGDPGSVGPAGPRGLKGKAAATPKIKIGGELATQVILNRIDKRVLTIQKELAKTKKYASSIEGYVINTLPGIYRKVQDACQNARIAQGGIKLHMVDGDNDAYQATVNSYGEAKDC